MQKNDTLRELPKEPSLNGPSAKLLCVPPSFSCSSKIEYSLISGWNSYCIGQIPFKTLFHSSRKMVKKQKIPSQHVQIGKIRNYSLTPEKALNDIIAVFFSMFVFSFKQKCFRKCQDGLECQRSFGIGSFAVYKCAQPTEPGSSDVDM